MWFLLKKTTKKEKCLWRKKRDFRKSGTLIGSHPVVIFKKTFFQIKIIKNNKKILWTEILDVVDHDELI